MPQYHAHVAKLVNVAVSEAVVIRLRSSSLLVGTVGKEKAKAFSFYFYTSLLFPEILKNIYSDKFVRIKIVCTFTKK
ncbi:MAG: hypothetical protein JWO09_2108 [Bacteroidetes bacterium]|nr:hypothetical protein [Bacteroidota bacterium]